MYRPVFELATFQVLSPEQKKRVLEAMLEALILANMFYLQSDQGRQAPPLYQAGVPYIAEPPGRDNWQDIPRCLELREGDCEDLASWLVAELRVRHNEAAKPYVDSRKIGNFTLYHIRVQRGDGRIEDPSRILGMK